jgi:predicted TIM-barrel fold metal-dependent hydrolase
MTLQDELAPEAMALADHHCHGLVRDELDAADVDALLSEGGAAPPGTSNFDTPVGLAVRRHCAPLLDLPAHAPAADYLARRAELGAEEVARRLLRASGTGTFLVDTGFRPAELTAPVELAALAGPAVAHPIVRLEAVADRLAGTGVEPREFGGAFAAALAAELAASGAVGLKSVAAYRVGLDLDPRRPAPAELATAVAAALGPDGRADRLADPGITRELLWAGAEFGLPIQLHIGYGDRDVRLHRSDPTLLSDLLQLLPPVPIMLLHCWPYQRQAGYLAAVWPQVYLDVGLTLSYVGPTRAPAVLAEAMELAPFGKLLYSSDAFGLPELYLLGAHTFRVALAEVLEAKVAAGEWSGEDARRIAGLACAGNAERVYRTVAP